MLIICIYYPMIASKTYIKRLLTKYLLAVRRKIRHKFRMGVYTKYFRNNGIWSIRQGKENNTERQCNSMQYKNWNTIKKRNYYKVSPLPCSNLSWEADGHPISQIPCLSWNLKVHCCSQEPVTCPLSWARWILSSPSYPLSLRSIVQLSSHICLGLSNGIFPPSFWTKILYTFLNSLMHVTWPTHLILFNFITVLTLGEAYKLWSSSVCSILQPFATSSLLGPNILITLSSHIPSYVYP